MQSEAGIIFIVGNSRSGTTMMSRILSMNPDVYSFHELHFFERFYSENMLEKKQAADILARLLRIDEEGFFGKSDLNLYSGSAMEILNSGEPIFSARVYKSFIEHALMKHNKITACEQTPQNVFYLSEILKIFPEARIINMVRDPRDILLSQKNKWRRRKLGAEFSNRFESMRSRMNYHPIVISRLWKSAVTAVSEFQSSSNVLTIQFEKLLANPKGIIQEICKHCKIEFSESMLEIPQVGSSEGLDNKNKTGFRQDRIEAWKNGNLNKTEIFICQQITKKEMLQFGYKTENISPSWFMITYYYISLPIKLIIAAMFNLHRIGNIFDAIRRRL